MEYDNNAVVRSKIFTMSVQVPKQPNLTEGIPTGAGELVRFPVVLPNLNYSMLL